MFILQNMLMTGNQKKVFGLFLFAGLSLASFAQDSTKKTTALADSAKKKTNSLIISFELRQRAEYRHGYRNIATHDTGAAFFVAQRARLNIAYSGNKFDLFASLQDARVWGQQDPRNPTQPLYLFEVYAEPHFTNKFSVRLGRQRIAYDNQRMFSENDWRTAGGSHDAARLIYNNKKDFATELTAAYNQNAENVFTSNYKPTGFINYKELFIHYLDWKPSDKINIITLNSADGYQSAVNYKTTYMRFTSGGRMEYSTPKWYLTLSGYYQYGKDSSGKKIAAYYLQPEIKYSGIKNYTFRLGMEYLSGHDATQPVTKDNNFVPLYGVAHRFMGNLDIFTTFPADVNNAGLVNPYLFLWYQKNKLLLRCENHLFYSQSNFISNGATIDKYLGFENDWRINYKANSFTDIEAGFCWAAVTKSMTIIRKGGDETTTPVWGYFSIKFTPVLGKFNF